MIEQMLNSAKEKIEFAYANALERKVEVPVVIVMDVRGDGGSWVAERVTEKSTIDAVVEESKKRGSTPVLTIAVSQRQAGLLLGQLNPETGAMISTAQLPDTHFLVVGITEGGEIAGRSFEKP